MSDRLQATGNWSIAVNQGLGVGWTDTDAHITVPSANHAQLGSGNVPTGGNFLFEDGHVSWFRFDVKNARGTVDVGASEAGWLCFYKLPNINTN
jgi:hypothetical protein